MNLIYDVLLLSVPVVLTLLGFYRGIQREALTLTGILLGALLGEWWAPTWATSSATRFNQNQQVLQVLIADGLLLLTAIFVGYGGALLLPSRRTLAKGMGRTYGAILGGLNGMFLIGVLLRNAARALPEQRPIVAETRLGPILAERLPLLTLWAVLGGSVVVVVLLITRLLQRLHGDPAKQKKQQEAKAAAAKAATKPAEPPKPVEPPKPELPKPETVTDPILRDLLIAERTKTKQ